MNKKLAFALLSLLGISVLIGAVYWGWGYKRTNNPTPNPPTQHLVKLNTEAILNGTYKFSSNDNEIIFTDGISRRDGEGVTAESKIDENTISFGDLNADEKEDVVFAVHNKSTYSNSKDHSVSEYKGIDLYAVLLGSGSPFLVKNSSYYLDESTEIMSIDIENGIITMNFSVDSSDGHGRKEFTAEYKIDLDGYQLIRQSLRPKENVLSKYLIMNAIYSPGTTFAGPNKELSYYEGVAQLPVQYEQDSSESEINKDFIVIEDLDKDGTQEVVFLLDDWYYNVGGSSGQGWQTLNVARKNEDKFSIIDNATIEQASVGEGESFATVKSLTVKNNIITLNIERETGCANLPAKQVVQNYKFADGKLVRLDQAEQEGEINITLLSPKKGDVWKIGESHKIILSQPWPFEDNCNNAIEIRGYANLATEDGRTLILRKGQSEYTWDSKHILPFFKDSDTPVSITLGEYDLSIESYVEDGPGYVLTHSESFQLVK
ncbi:MAG: hypothetical protein WAV15_02295 [Minisyncoccia bacterium]